MRREWTEAEAKKDLAIDHSAFAWKQAKRYAADKRYEQSQHYGRFSYWERVRVLYLELGGLGIGQLKKREQGLYPTPPVE